MFYREIQDMFQPTASQPRQDLSLNLIMYSSPNLHTIELHEHNNSSLTTNKSTSDIGICAVTTNIQQPKESKVYLVVDFIDTYFSKRLNDSDQTSVNSVAILIITGPNFGAAEDITAIQKERYNQTNVRLFVIVADFNHDIMEKLQIPNTLFVTSISSIDNNHLISMFICGRCKQGWFILDKKASRNLISCYFLDLDAGRLKNWFDGSRRCGVLGSSLASVETPEEHEFLERQVADTLISGGGVSQDFDIFIGLSRDPDSLAKRFRWLSGNPLITSRWLAARPRKDYLLGCVVWKFGFRGTNLSSNFIHEGNVSESTITFNNGWVDVSCGVPVTDVSICEVDLHLPNTGKKRSLKLKPASTNAKYNALNKGEFVMHNGNIVSIPANAGNPDFYSSLQERFSRFELFYCDECWFNSKALSYSQLCDRVQDCVFGGDESICSFRNCDPRREFQCRSGQCVPAAARCDIYNDCFDESDEAQCTECTQKRCCEGSCIPKHWLPDIDCSSCHNNDFGLLGNTTESNDEHCPFICNRTTCVNPSNIGNGVVDCRGPEGPLDERLGILEKALSCDDEDAEVGWAPRCVYIRDRYNGVLGCRDLSHLWNCESFPCPAGYIKCPGSYCIPLHLAQDGQRDCPLGEDEEYTNELSCLGNFACANSQVCLHPDLVCDGSLQCPSGDDELNCHVSCASGFRCLAGTVSVADYDKTIPLSSLKFVDSRTRLLDLSGLNISRAIIGPDIMHLINLLIVRFTNCKLTIAEGIFSGSISSLQSIYHLDLRYNLLQSVTKNSSFRHMSNLRILDLSYNGQLAVLEGKAFLPYNGKSLLERLNLQNTAVATLNSAVLQGLNNLKVLNLSFTLITGLYKDSFPKNFRLQFLDFRETLILYYGSDSFNGLRIDKYMHTDNFGLCCPEVRGANISDEACLSPDDTISSCSHLVREKVQRVLLWLVGVVAFLGNVTVILCRLVWHRGDIKKSYGVFVTNLGISDLIMGLYLLIIASADAYYTDNYVLNGNIWKSGIACQVAGFLSTLSSETSAFFIMLVTIDRYLVMKFPFGQCHFSKRGVLAATCLAWAIGFTLAVIPLLPMIDSWMIYSSNAMCVGLPLNSDRIKGWRYSVSVFIVLNSFVFVAIATGQFSIYRAMSGNRTAATAAQNSKRRAQDIAVAKQLSLIVLSDFLCWFPIGLMGVLAVTGHELSNNVYTWAAVLVLPVNSAINPLLYTIPILHDKWRQFVASESKRSSKAENKGDVNKTTR